jgi:hypothetical protein
VIEERDGHLRDRCRDLCRRDRWLEFERLLAVGFVVPHAFAVVSEVEPPQQQFGHARIGHAFRWLFVPPFCLERCAGFG